jgi:uncharacterized membrane protein
MPVGLHLLALLLHLVGVVLWVGGMVFIRVCLVSTAITTAQWAEALEHFFPIAWSSILLIIASGGFMLTERGYSNAPSGWLLMAVTGSIMSIIFVSIWFGPWQVLRAALVAGVPAQARARAAMHSINKRLDIVLVLATLTATAATLGLSL